MYRLTPWVILLLVIFSVWLNLPPLKYIPEKLHLFGKEFKIIDLFPLKLGLDLQGGTELILQAQMDKINPEAKDEALEAAKEVLERRVNLYGVSEAVVRTSKLGDERRILIELPGVKDLQTAINLVGQTAQLEFREIEASSSAEGQEASPSAVAETQKTKPTGLTGADLKKAQVTFGSAKANQSGPQVAIEFTEEGAKKFADITKRNVGKPLAIFLDGVPVSAPVVEQEIIGGSAVISGQFTLQQAKNLSIQLNAGALPVPIKVLHQRSIAATLGNDSVQKSLVAGIIGLVTVMIYMVIYYGILGVIANCALLIYTLVVLVVFRTGLFILPPVTLTLAGIAGFILSIGMAVDANILIFERMKEELRDGKEASRALKLGFSRAWSSIRDSNISSLISAGILFAIGTSVVRGFALTLAIGVLVSMFSAIVVSKTLLSFLPRFSKGKLL